MLMSPMLRIMPGGCDIEARRQAGAPLRLDHEAPHALGWLRALFDSCHPRSRGALVAPLH